MASARLIRAGLAFAAAAWAALILLTPGWMASPVGGPVGGHADRWALAARATRVVGSRICHQRPERSFHLHGRPMPVCGRCAGLYLSGATGLVLASVAARRRGVSGGDAAGSGAGRFDPRATRLAWAALPTVLTWGLEVIGVWNPGTPLRAVAAVPLGAMAGWLAGRALDDTRAGARVDGPAHTRAS